jgi:hypothetical protein
MVDIAVNEEGNGQHVAVDGLMANLLACCALFIWHKKCGNVDPAGQTIHGAPRFHNPQRMPGGPAYAQSPVIGQDRGDHNGPSHDRWDHGRDPV